MAQNLTNFDEALRIDYLPVIRGQLENSTYLLSKLERNERDVYGKEWRGVVHYQRTSGVGSGTETALPTAGNQAYKNPSGTVRYHRGRIQVTGKCYITLGPLIERLMGIITSLNSVNILGIGQYRANCMCQQGCND